jgi:hemolysin III
MIKKHTPKHLFRLHRTKSFDPIMKRLPIGRRWVITEPASALSHLIGACGAGAALVSLLFYPTERMGGIHLTAFIIYTVSMIAVFLASAAYHGLPTNRKKRRILNKIDHAMIYFFIVGSYVPVFLIAAPPAIGIPIVVAVSLIGTIGAILEFSKRPKNRFWGALIYVLMGWIGIFGMHSLSQVLPGSVTWIIAGGALYTVGAILYAMRRPNPLPQVLGAHEIFHVLVLAGCLCHFNVIWFMILPSTFA